MFSSTRFQQLLKGLPRAQFDRAVNRHQSDRYSKGFRCWDQFVAMAYAQISGARSLRELETGMNAQSLHLYHLGTRSVRRSTLSDANAKRDWRVFESLCQELISQVNRQQRKAVKAMLYLMDSTPIPLKGRAYETWASANKTHRTQGLKTHVMIDQHSDTPVYVDITAPNVNDIEIGRQIPIEPGATYVFDKGYYDYNWWYRIHQQKAFFVTRFKTNASVTISEQRPVDEKAQEIILRDEVVMFKNRRPGSHRINDYHGTPLRRIVVKRPDKDTPLVLATNDLESPATQVARYYKQRWDIELFFKWLKQNLKLKSFLGQSENAVRTQIYIAIITYLMVFLLKTKESFKGSMRTFLVALKASLFQRSRTEYYQYRKRKRERDELLKIQAHLPL